MINKKVYIWGAGDDGKRLLSNDKYLAVVAQGVIDIRKREVENKGFFNLPIFLPEEICWDEAYIIIATRKYKDQVIEYLEKKNKIENIDFITFETAYKIYEDNPYNIRFEKRYFELQEYLGVFERWIDDVDNKVYKNKDSLRNFILHGGMTSTEYILRCCSESDQNIIKFLDGTILEYVNVRDLSRIVEEILFNEDYYFDSSSDVPIIIDGGANIGLAIYYFKYLYPNSKIIAFEPNPDLYIILKRNIERNGWESIDVYPYAIGGENGSVSFYIQKSSIAGSMEKRNTVGIDDEEINEIIVDEIKLSDYINENIDYLKLDIEGAETRCIEDISKKLDNIKHVFIEFHEGPLKNYNYISKILCVLENAGFEIYIGSSFFKQRSFRPMNKVGKRISECIWAKKA